MLIHRYARNQPCIDELEVYGPDTPENLADHSRGATPTASSCLAGYVQHAVAHLNDGRYGNQHSWISAGEAGEWAQIQLPSVTRVSKVVFLCDRNAQYADRLPVDVEVLLSLDGEVWESAARVQGRAIDHHVVGPSAGIPVAPPPPARGTERGSDLIEYAILGQEHAWLKTYGRADLSERLVPYNGRVKEYPRHAPDDRLPLPPCATPSWTATWTILAGSRDARRGASRLSVRLRQGPLVSFAVTAGHDSDSLCSV